MSDNEYNWLSAFSCGFRKLVRSAAVTMVRLPRVGVCFTGWTRVAFATLPNVVSVVRCSRWWRPATQMEAALRVDLACTLVLTRPKLASLSLPPVMRPALAIIAIIPLASAATVTFTPLSSALPAR